MIVYYQEMVVGWWRTRRDLRTMRKAKRALRTLRDATRITEGRK